MSEIEPKFRTFWLSEKLRVGSAKCLSELIKFNLNQTSDIGLLLPGRRCVVWAKVVLIVKNKEQRQNIRHGAVIIKLQE